MFQYAAGRALSLRFGLELKLDISWFDDMSGCTPRRFSLDIFPISATFATKQECESLIWRRESSVAKVFRKITKRFKPHAATYVSEPYALDPQALDASNGAYLSGYWQSVRYFAAQADIVRNDFTFPKILNSASIAMLKTIEAQPDATSVHIRRGDYISNKSVNAMHGICSQNYYDNAINTITSQSRNPHLFLFSDDPEWVRDNFNTCGLPSTIVDLHSADTGYHDLHLMSLCKHHIIANSSFSWWGAWLSTRNGLVCAPKQWFAASRKENISPIPDGWISL